MVSRPSLQFTRFPGRTWEPESFTALPVGAFNARHVGTTGGLRLSPVDLRARLRFLLAYSPTELRATRKPRKLPRIEGVTM